jgi:hypothetical protein
MTTFGTMPEVDLLPLFLSCTGFRAELPIPQYLQNDAKLFFHGFTTFRGTLGSIKSSVASAVGETASVAVAQTATAVASTAGRDIADLTAATPGKLLRKDSSATLDIYTHSKVGLNSSTDFERLLVSFSGPGPANLTDSKTLFSCAFKKLER